MSFVCKPNQIETVWDSILRGFPIGALLMSETNSGILELLDGQQRCTFISLGFFNPWEKEDVYFLIKIIQLISINLQFGLVYSLKDLAIHINT